MADPEHLEWLKEGVDAWNARRRANRFKAQLQEADLQKADLHRADLQKADLHRADLRKAVLRDAILRGANLLGSYLLGAELQGAELQGADLRHAKLRRVDLQEANLHKADLRRADLRDAVLRKAVLQEADLQGANLRRANLLVADFDEADLRGAKLQGADLTEANLDGTDLRTFVYSPASTNGGSGPEYTDLSTALGLVQYQIEEARGDNGTILPEGLTHPVLWDIIDLPPDHPNYEAPQAAPQDADIFLSYSHKDQTRATLVYEHLKANGFSVWWDQKIGAGDRWREAIAENLDSSKIVLTLWSAASVTSASVCEEAETAKAARKLVHARLDNAKLPYGFGEIQYVSLAGWDGAPDDSAFQKLVQNLRDKLAPPSHAQLTERLNRASPVAFEVDRGKLTPKDTPLQTPPAVLNDVDKTARIAGLLATAQGVQAMVADRDAYQVPNELVHRVDRLVSSLDRDDVIWYALEDARDGLMGCMARFDAPNTWNDGIVDDLNRVIVRIAEVQPLLQPEQLPVDSENGKPPETDPTITASDLPELRALSEEVAAVIHEEEGDAVLDDATDDTIQTNVDAIQEEDQLSNDPAIQDQQFSKLRRAVKGLAYTVGGVIAAVGGGVAVNLLTAPEAAATLALRLQPIMERLLALFY